MGKYYYEILLFHSLSGRNAAEFLVRARNTPRPGGLLLLQQLAKGECNNSDIAVSSLI